MEGILPIIFSEVIDFKEDQEQLAVTVLSLVAQLMGHASLLQPLEVWEEATVLIQEVTLVDMSVS